MPLAYALVTDTVDTSWGWSEWTMAILGVTFAAILVVCLMCSAACLLEYWSSSKEIIVKVRKKDAVKMAKQMMKANRDFRIKDTLKQDFVWFCSHDAYLHDVACDYERFS